MNRLDKQFKISLLELANKEPEPTSIYMVIPRAGCNGCISDAERYLIRCLEDSLDHDYIHFILTDFDSEKTLRARFGALYKSSRLLIDQQDSFISNKSLTSSYPTIYFFDANGDLSAVSEMSPSKNGIGDIDSWVLENWQNAK